MARLATRRSNIALIDALVPIGGGGGVYGTGTQTQDFQSVTEGTYDIPPDQYLVKVYNTGVLDITVNGDTVKPGDPWESRAFSNPNTRILDLTPAIQIIVPLNGSASYNINGPS